MNIARNITVAIITKNRCRDLRLCLVSLLAQSKNPAEIIVVDNASIDSTKEVVLAMGDNTQVTIEYITQLRGARSYSRNTALERTRTRWLAFIDDDCVARMDWVESMEKQLRNGNQVVVGESLGYRTSGASHCFLASELLWKKNSRVGTSMRNFFALDTKNIVYDVSFLRKHNLRFDVNENIDKISGEDGDFGMRLYEKDATAVYATEMVVFHKHPSSLSKFISKQFTDNTMYHLLRARWLGSSEPFRGKTGISTFVMGWYRKHHGLTQAKSLLLALCLIGTSLLIKLTKPYSFFLRKLP